MREHKEVENEGVVHTAQVGCRAGRLGRCSIVTNEALFPRRPLNAGAPDRSWRSRTTQRMKTTIHRNGPRGFKQQQTKVRVWIQGPKRILTKLLLAGCSNSSSSGHGRPWGQNEGGRQKGASLSAVQFGWSSWSRSGHAGGLPEFQQKR